MTHPHHIVLIGFMGSGKTTVGHLVAEKLDWPFVDTDSQIVDGNPNEVQKVVDLWTFRRDTTSGDPNWQLVKTESEG